MRLFEVTSPRGAVLRQAHPTLEIAKSRLHAGYTVSGEVFGADAKSEGGIVDNFSVSPVVAMLLDGRNGAWLDDWLVKRLAVHEQSKASSK